MIRNMSWEEIDALVDELKFELRMAEIDYKRKKALKGETVSIMKMRLAINHRQKIRKLGDKLLYAHMARTNILHKPIIEKAIDDYERGLSLVRKEVKKNEWREGK